MINSVLIEYVLQGLNYLALNLICKANCSIV